jgi:DNA-binding transcriptional LysR family regulator
MVARACLRGAKTGAAGGGMQINDRRIHFLYEAWRSGSMRQASEILEMAPSSISRQIAQLEREIGSTLIEHGRREIVLTEAGHAVLEYYRNRHSSLEMLNAQLRDLSAARTGHVKFAIGEGFLGEALYRTLDEFMDGYPGFTLSLSVTDTTEMVRLLLEDEVHFGLGFHPLSHPQVVSRFRAAVPLKAIMHAAHPLADRSSISIAELCAEPLALMGQAFRIRQMIDLAAADSGQLVSPVLVSNSIPVLIRSACARRAVTVLPEFSVRSELSNGQLVAVRIVSSAMQSVYVHLITRRNRILSPQVMALTEQMRKRLAPTALYAPTDGKEPAAS